MKIERNGVEYVLTDKELWFAFLEQQVKCDLADIKNNIEDFAKEGTDISSITEDEYKKMAVLHRKYFDDHDQWRYSAEKAVNEILKQRLKGTDDNL